MLYPELEQNLSVHVFPYQLISSCTWDKAVTIFHHNIGSKLILESGTWDNIGTFTGQVRQISSNLFHFRRRVRRAKRRWWVCWQLRSEWSGGSRPCTQTGTKEPSRGNSSPTLQVHDRGTQRSRLLINASSKP
jgi:hypothetical protein